MELNVARAQQDIANSELRTHQQGCTKSCTVSGAPLCWDGEALVDAAIHADDNLRHAQRLAQIAQYEQR